MLASFFCLSGVIKTGHFMNLSPFSHICVSLENNVKLKSSIKNFNNSSYFCLQLGIYTRMDKIFEI